MNTLSLATRHRWWISGRIVVVSGLHLVALVAALCPIIAGAASGAGLIGVGRPQQVGPGIGANTQDPRKILKGAADALRGLKSVSYEARYRGTGAFATMTPTVVAKASLSKLAPTDPLIARLAAEGVFYPSGSDEANGFRTTFDGHQLRRLSTKTKVVVEKNVDTDPNGRTLGSVTGLFGGGAYHVLLLEYVQPTPLSRQLDAHVADYEGRTNIDGVLCHVVYLEYSLANGRVTRERWFIGVADNLPREVEDQVVDDQGRCGAYVLTLSNVRVNPTLVESDFSITTPAGYTVKQYEPPEHPPLLPTGAPGPGFRLMDSEGRPHALADYRGKLVVLDFWATWCGPCLQAMPSMQRLHEKYHTRGVEILGINVWEESNATAYMKERGYTYPLLLKGETAAEAYHATILPTVYVIGTDGTILHGGTATSADTIEELVVRHLRERH